MRAPVLALLLLLASPAHAAPVRVADDAGLRAALAEAGPGTTILVAPGTYRGGLFVRGLWGTEAKPVTIAGEDPERPPRIEGGGTGLQESGAAWVEVRDLVLAGASGNGANVDDGGAGEPSRHVTLRRVTVEDVGPTGNADGIKLSGVDDFLVEGCTVRRWGDGGSGVDLVGCHRGRIERCAFAHEGGKGASGVQAKGGSSDVAIVGCRFVDAGQRAVNLGGSTGEAWFRPPGAPHEAKDLLVEDCTFEGSLAAVAFVGVDGAVVRHNTLRRPGRWVLRILQESTGPRFVPCQNGRFERNLVTFRSADVRVHVNVGPGTAPETFAFAENFWLCEDDPGRSRPALPTAETGGVYGREESQAGGYGAR
jgi:hypothetical protein